MSTLVTRIVAVLLATSILAVFPASRARAQETGEGEGGGAPPVAPAAAPDTLLAPVTGLLHPSYRTAFSVLKTRQTWTQGLTGGQRLGPVDLRSTLSSSINKDSAQNDLEHYVSRIQNALDYNLIAGVKVGVQTDFDRTKQLTNASQLRQTNDRYGFTGEAAHPVLSDAFEAKLTGQAGYRESVNSSERKVGALGRRDRTTQTGPNFAINGRFANQYGTKPRPDPYVSLEYQSQIFRQETEEQQIELASDLTTITSQRDTTLEATNSTRKLTAVFGWVPSSWMTTDVNLSRSVASELRPSPRRGELEETERDDTAGVIDIGLTPAPDLVINCQLRAAEKKLGSNINAVSNRDTRESGFTIGGSYAWPQGAPRPDRGHIFAWLWRTIRPADVSMKLEQRTEDQDYKPVAGATTQVDLRSEFLRLEGKASRPLGAKLVLNFTGDISLDQKFYDDGILDDDRQDRSLDASLGYTPYARLRTRISVTENRRRTVSVDPSRAANTNTEERITVGGWYEYTSPWKIKVEQTINVIAQSRVFDFNDEGQSNLTRTNRVLTKVTGTLLPLTVINFQHNYNFRNSGEYSRGLDGVRRFLLQREFIEQELDVGATYSPLSWLSIGTTQSLRVVTDRSPGTRGTRTTEYEYRFKTDFNRKLLGTIQANLSVTRVLSTREEHHWRVEMAASQVF